MKISDLKNIEYWTEEYKLPLFLLSNSSGAFSDNLIFLYKNNTVKLYALGNRKSVDEQKGYNYFMKKDGFEKYFIRVENIEKLIADFVSRVKKQRLKELDDQELQNLFWESLRVLEKYGKVYDKAEPIYLKKFENIKNKKVLSQLNQVAKQRLKLKKMSHTIFYVLIEKILTELARRSGLTVKDLYFYTMDELVALLLKNKKVNIKKRKSGYLLWKRKGQQGIIIGTKFKEFNKYIEESLKFGFQNNTLKGYNSNKGKVTARVSLLLHNKENLSKEVKAFKKGRVLVTEMTRPNTILACKKAVAIVTDEGGITCHAAIISRELKIPCIVGTKIATKVLKDGDMVEVDANNGIVKIL
ncbi:hypothetical protein HQ571_00325 [Candidatus Kuenenbacteria bacterium]|nr:hypothetical protein [Candidatus Kuenenbacteria bacterium]